MPRPAQMHHGGIEDNSIGGCLMNLILLLFFGIMWYSCQGVRLGS